MSEPRDEATQATMAAMLPKLLAAPQGRPGPSDARPISQRTARRRGGQTSGDRPRARTGRPVRDHPLAGGVRRGPKVSLHPFGQVIVDEVAAWSSQVSDPNL